MRSLPTGSQPSLRYGYYLFLCCSVLQPRISSFFLLPLAVVWCPQSQASPVAFLPALSCAVLRDPGVAPPRLGSCWSEALQTLTPASNTKTGSGTTRDGRGSRRSLSRPSDLQTMGRSHGVPGKRAHRLSCCRRCTTNPSSSATRCVPVTALGPNEGNLTGRPLLVALLHWCFLVLSRGFHAPSSDERTSLALLCRY